MQRWLHKHIRLIISRDESGQALLITMAVILVLALIPTLIASTVAQRAGLTLAFQNGASASAAAQAGLADYEGHLTSNSFYPAVYNAGNNYTSNNVQSSNKAFFQWVPVPQTPNEWYSYRVVQVPASPGSSTSSGPPTYAVIVAGCAGVLASPTSPCTGGNSAHGNQIDVISRQVQLASPFFNAYFTKYELYDPYDPNYYPSSGSSQDALPSTGQVSAVADHCVALASTKPSAGTGSFPPPVETVGSSSEGYYSQNGGYGPDLAWSTTINGRRIDRVVHLYHIACNHPNQWTGGWKATLTVSHWRYIIAFVIRRKIICLLASAVGGYTQASGQVKVILGYKCHILRNRTLDEQIAR